MKRIRVFGLLALLSLVATTAQAAIWDGRTDTNGSFQNTTGAGALTWNNTQVWVGDQSTTVSMRGPAAANVNNATASATGNLDDLWFPIYLPAAATATGGYNGMTLANYAGAWTTAGGGSANTAPQNIQLPSAFWYANDMIFGDNGSSGTDNAPGLARGIDFGVGVVPAAYTTASGIPAAGTWYNPNGTNFIILNLPSPNATNTAGAAVGQNRFIADNIGTDQPSLQIAMVDSSVSGVRNLQFNAPIIIAGDSFLIKRQGSAGTDARTLTFGRFFSPFVATNTSMVNSNVSTQAAADLIISNLNAAGNAAATNALDAIVLNGPTSSDAQGSANVLAFNNYSGTVYLEAGYLRLIHESSTNAGFTDNYFGPTTNAVKVGILHTSLSGDNSGGVAGPVILDLNGAWTGMGYNFELSNQAGKTLQINHAVSSLPLSGKITGGAGYGNVSLKLDGGASSNVTVITGTVAGNGTNTTIGEVDVLAGNLQVDGKLYGAVAAAGNVAVNGTWGATVNNLVSGVEKLTVAGTLTLGGSSVLDLVGDSLDAEAIYILADYGSLSGTFGNYADGAAVGASHIINYAFDLGGGDNKHVALVAVPVPEPGTLALLGVAGLLGLAVARRRRK